MNNLTTVDQISAFLTKEVQDGKPVDPATWLEAALAINQLLQFEQEKLFILEQNIAKAKTNFIESGKTASASKVAVESLDTYVEMRKQKAKVERAIEMIKLAKANARLSRDVYNSNWCQREKT